MRPLAPFLCLLFSACGAGSSSSLPPRAATFDGEEARLLTNAQSVCFKRESLSNALAHVDLETAALAVQGSCAAETQRFKAFSARNTIESVPVFEARWRRVEADDLQTIRQ